MVSEPARTDRQAVRLLALLGAGAATVEPTSRSGSLLVRNGKGAVTVEKTLLARLASEGLILRHGGRIWATGAGSKAAARANTADDGFQLLHRQTASLAVEDGAGMAVADVNLAESPLGLLMRRTARNGRPFLTRDEFDAGERLRSDYTRGSIMPRLGVNWEPNVAGGRRGERGGVAELTEAAMAARQRVDRALRTVGPELSGLLVDVCCFLKGLETVERERLWPARSAKLVLKTALAMLARHYHPPRDAKARPSVLHWGADGYRPDMS